MEDRYLSNADTPKTSRRMEQEANTETQAHLPEQECGEPLSIKQDLEERVKQLENEVRTLKKLLQHEKEVNQSRELENREFQNKIEDLQERLETSKNYKRILELEKALDAQKKVLQMTTSKGQKAIIYCTKQYDDMKEENDDLKKRFDALNDLYMQQRVEDEMKRINVGEDKVDGSDVLTITDDILPLVQKGLKPSFYWRNPFGCMAGCTMSATHFVLSDGWKKRLCELKFARVIQKKVDELSKIQQSTEVPKEKVMCSYSLKDILNIGLLKLDHVLSGDIHNYHDLQRCIEHLKLSEKALIVIHRDDGLSHCMAIYKCSDQSKPNARVEIFDVQSGKLWPRSPQHVTVVKRFEIYLIEESMKEEFEKECSILLCISERKCACIQQLPQQTPDQI